MQERLPILISIPHGGTRVPEEVRDNVCIDSQAFAYYSDPATQRLYDMGDLAGASMQAEISRLIIDLNRPPQHLPPRHPDGVVKTKTSFGQPIWKEEKQPGLACIRRLLQRYYFPYHAGIDRALLTRKVTVALDCHAMVPVGLPGQPDAGQKRTLFCLSNNGDENGHGRPGTLPTCPAEWIQTLADSVRDEFPGAGSVAINYPFHGGFIMNAHFWHTGVPWIQIEMNRSLYESDVSSPGTGSITDESQIVELNGILKNILREWIKNIL